MLYNEKYDSKSYLTKITSPMSKIKELSPKANVNLLFVDTDGYANCNLYGDDKIDELRYVKMVSEGKFKSVTVRLPPGDYTPLGIATELSEEVVRELVESPYMHFIDDEDQHPDVRYKDYEDPDEIEKSDYSLYDTSESFASLLRAHNISERSLVLRAKK